MFLLGRLAEAFVRLVHALSVIGGHHQHQVEQMALDRVVLRIVPDKSLTADHPYQLRQAVQDTFEPPIHVDLEVKEWPELPRSGNCKA